MSVLRRKLVTKSYLACLFHITLALLMCCQSYAASVSGAKPSPSNGSCPYFYIPDSVLTGGLELAGEVVPITRPDVKARIEFQINFLLFDARSVLAEWLNEKRKYSWIFDEAFSKQGIPKDFTWLSPVLSGISRSFTRLSPAGIWALDRPCSSAEGVEMHDDNWRDDRLDINLATLCFSCRIKNLKQDLGTSWLMTSVAYVLSAKTAKDLMEKWNSSSVWDIPLPDNLEDMLSRWAAFKIIGTHRSVYGLKISDPAPLTYDNLTSIQLVKDLPVAEIAKFINVSPRLILELNPKIKPNSGTFPAKPNGRLENHSIAVPSGSGRALLQKLQESGYLAPNVNR